MNKLFTKLYFQLLVSILLITTSSFVVHKANPVSTVMQKIVEKIYKENQLDKFDKITQRELLSYIDPASLDILANQYWSFYVNTDVEVLVCRDINQKEIPFWLSYNQFTKTKEFIKNENVTYEVWRKVFKKGKVNLGINGFDRHRFVYFVAIKPINKKIKLQVEPIWPLDQRVLPLQVGSYIYKDWDELTITSYSSIFENSYILPTYRGRSREAHLIGAFRSTNYPSSGLPDQLLLSWIDDTRTTQHISWRTNLKTTRCTVKYWENNTGDTVMINPSHEIVNDMLLSNDVSIKRYKVNITNLRPNTVYHYQILSNTGNSDIHSFKTGRNEPVFEFGWFGDMHNDPKLGYFIPKWQQMFPRADFYLQAGDLVNTGLFRDNWDQLFNVTRSITNNKPFMVVPGNHDSQEALFPSMYLSYFKFPDNGPVGLPKGLSYHFTYANTLFLMIDALTLNVDSQKKWIENTLKGSKEKFKIVVFHFAPHTFESTYPDILEHWEPLFQAYNVDLVFNGHFHYYHKTNEKQQPKYIMSVATKSKGEDISIKAGEFYVKKGYLYQHIKIQDTSLELTSVDSTGNIIDQFKLTKN